MMSMLSSASSTVLKRSNPGWGALFAKLQPIWLG